MTGNMIPSADLRNLFPGEDVVRPLVVPSSFFQEFASAELPALFPYEQLVLAAIAHYASPRLVLEFGTGQGFSSYVWAENTPDHTEIVTIDLEPSVQGAYTEKILRGDSSVGRIYEASPGASKVKQVFVRPGAELPDTIESLKGSVDLVFIDGDHSYEGVKHDTEQALKLAHSQSVFVWHDFYRFPEYVAQSEKRGVYPYLNALADSDDLSLFHINGTYLVVGRRSWPSDIPATLRQPEDLSAPMGERIIRLGEF